MIAVLGYNQKGGMTFTGEATSGGSSDPAGRRQLSLPQRQPHFQCGERRPSAAAGVTTSRETSFHSTALRETLLPLLAPLHAAFHAAGGRRIWSRPVNRKHVKMFGCSRISGVGLTTPAPMVRSRSRSSIAPTVFVHPRRPQGLRKPVRPVFPCLLLASRRIFNE